MTIKKDALCVIYSHVKVWLTEMDSSTFDVIIVGAGVVGSSTGYYLTSNTNKKVLLIEQVQIVQLQSVHVISSLIGFILEVVLTEHHVS